MNSASTPICCLIQLVDSVWALGELRGEEQRMEMEGEGYLRLDELVNDPPCKRRSFRSMATSLVICKAL